MYKWDFNPIRHINKHFSLYDATSILKSLALWWPWLLLLPFPYLHSLLVQICTIFIACYKIVLLHVTVQNTHLKIGMMIISPCLTEPYEKNKKSRWQHIVGIKNKEQKRWSFLKKWEAFFLFPTYNLGVAMSSCAQGTLHVTLHSKM